jgi:hypothetical protein
VWETYAFVVVICCPKTKVVRERMKIMALKAFIRGVE